MSKKTRKYLHSQMALTKGGYCSEPHPSTIEAEVPFRGTDSYRFRGKSKGNTTFLPLK